MSHRPRLAGDGRLLVPGRVIIDTDYLRGRMSERTIDPFDWTSDRLLLTESFARLELAEADAVKTWFKEHGIVDRAGFVGPPSEVPEDDWLWSRGEEFADSGTDIGTEQRNLVWHLTMLERLSARRIEKEWDPTFGQLIVDGAEGDLVVGGPHAGTYRTSTAVMDVLDTDRVPDPRVQEARARAVVVGATTEGWPLVSVGERDWYDFWEEPFARTGLDLPEQATEKARTLGRDWDLAIALEWLLLAPLVAHAVERRFLVTFSAQETGFGVRDVLVPRERRIWGSILAPIYLQLFEALRRISEGEPGAAICRECGRPFLVLDGRRRFFCNDRERTRYSQRERRRRIAAEDSASGTDSARVDMSDTDIER